MTTGCYPGSFDPPTVAHLAIVRTAIERLQLDRLDLVLSRVALAKSNAHAPLDVRLDVLEASLRDIPGASVTVTDDQLIADIAAGYDAVVMGADKWEQINDPVFYGGDAAAARRAVRSLPRIAVVARPPSPVPPGVELLIDDPELTDGISSTRARAGDQSMMTDAARRMTATGTWWG